VPPLDYLISFSRDSLVLELLAVDPDFQRMGAGSALVAWGTKAADQKGIKVRRSLVTPIRAFLLLQHTNHREFY
jgi:predicted N-acetyltransferase YhbS